MESISKALAVIGTIGVVCGIMGCIGLFAGVAPSAISCRGPRLAS